MINIMIERVIIFVAVILFSFNISAQNKFGEYEQKCKENLSMFREYYKQKNYADAYNPWIWAFNNCPESSQNIYKNGPKIVKEKMKAEKENVSAYVDTLMMIFDQRIKYFGKEGYVLGLKGYELIGVDKTRSEEAIGYLKQSLDLDGNDASVQAVYGYMKAMVNLEKSENKTKENVLEAYDMVSEIIDFNIINESKSTKNFIKYSEKITSLFTPYANCDDLIKLFAQKFATSADDVKFLKRITKLLGDENCTDSDLFFNASSRLYELDPSAVSAYQMSKMSIEKGKKYDAIAFANNAIDLEDDPNKKSKYYLALADAYRSSGSYSSARGAVYSALELRKGWGEAYINLGSIYVAGAKSCSTDFETQTAYLIAVDAFKKALLDPETNDRASKSISTYSKYFPTKETCFFNNVTAGTKYKIGCWIDKTTIVRTSD
jgi:Tfp pilus assembly protein PilF